MDEIFVATLQIVRALETLGVAYYVGGSVVSSIHGVPRTTHNVDIVALLRVSHAAKLTALIKDRFYVDEDMIRESIETSGCFNVIFLSTMFKVDIFTPKKDRKIEAELRRRQRFLIGGNEELAIQIASAEDIALEKLRWYELTSRTSERQWIDVLGVLKVRGDKIDLDYMRTQAEDRGLTELLDRALAESGHS